MLVVSWASVLTRLQVGYLGGVTDEYFPLGAKLLINGTLGPAADEPSTLRPPGYPAFVAAVLAIAAPSPDRVSAEAFTRQGQVAVLLAQGLLLAGACGVLSGWLSHQIDPRIAAAAGLILGVNPFSLVLVGLFHYGVLHIATMVVSVALTERAVSAQARWPHALLAGTAWGLSTLVRPVTLLVPLTLALALLLRRQGPARRGLAVCATLGAGLLLTLAPWGLRNFRLTGRLVAVSDNAWPTLWAQVASPVPHDPNRYAWFDVYTGGFQDVFASATGLAGYDYLAHNRQISAVEAAYRRDALRQLRAHPGIYLGNVGRAAAGLLTAEPLVMVAAFRAVQEQTRHGGPPAPGVGQVPQTWLLSGQPQPVLPRGTALALRSLMFALEAIALAGLVGSVARPRTWGAGILAAFLCVMATHALVFVHLMHYYLRLPFLAIFAADALDRIVRAPGPGRRLGLGAAGALAIGTAAASAVALFR